YSASSRTVALTATVTSPGGTVNQSTVTFTVLSGSTTIGSPVSVSVASGSASANYTLPAGLAGGTYTIKAAYAGAQDFQRPSDSTPPLTARPAAPTTAAASVTTTFSSSAQTVKLTATVTSSAGTVGEGSETFTVLNGTTVIGTATTGNVAGGAVSVSYTIPANTPAGSYTIKAVYNGTAEFLKATDIAHVLTINAAPAAAPAAAITATSLTPTGGVGMSPVQLSPQAVSLLSTGVGASTLSSGHKVHRSSITMNRGPLAIGGRAITKHLRPGQKLPVADRRSHA